MPVSAGPIGPGAYHELEIPESLFRNEVRSDSLRVLTADDCVTFDGLLPRLGCEWDRLRRFHPRKVEPSSNAIGKLIGFQDRRR